MDPNKQIEDIERIAEETVIDDTDAVDETESVDDFIRQLEEKEKDLHITADTTIIEIAEGFEDGELPDYLKQDFEPNGNKVIEPEISGPFSSLEDSEVEALEHKAGELKGDAAGLEREVEGLRTQIAKMEAEREEMFKTSQRRARDFENYKARTERERGETFQSQLGNLATQMLPALDNLNRAVDFANDMPQEDRESVQQFFEGIVLVSRQLTDVLECMGIRPIKTIGQPFDPHYHEAVATVETVEFPPNTICAELLRGYRVGDRVIRHSMVKVAVGRKDEGPAGNDTAEEVAGTEENSGPESSAGDEHSAAESTGTGEEISPL